MISSLKSSDGTTVATVMRDGDGITLSVYPVGMQVDAEALCEWCMETVREVAPTMTEEALERFRGYCEARGFWEGERWTTSCTWPAGTGSASRTEGSPSSCRISSRTSKRGAGRPPTSGGAPGR